MVENCRIKKQAEPARRRCRIKASGSSAGNIRNGKPNLSAYQAKGNRIPVHSVFSSVSHTRIDGSFEQFSYR